MSFAIGIRAWQIPLIGVVAAAGQVLVIACAAPEDEGSITLAGFLTRVCSVLASRLQHRGGNGDLIGWTFMITNQGPRPLFSRFPLLALLPS